MAGGRWGDQAVLIRGFDNGSKTGSTTELPSMLEERNGCSAVITGNTIVAMGGRGKTTGRVRSVEAFTLGGYTWRYLPAMNEIRSGATANVTDKQTNRMQLLLYWFYSLQTNSL
jgi:hypothetical protein